MSEERIGNYYQHILDIFLNDEISYEMISSMYGGEEVVSVQSLTKSHTNKDRGNLPRGIKPEFFYENVFCGVYYNDTKKKIFAGQLCLSLEHDGCFPDEWKDKKDCVSGLDERFDVELFHTFIVFLLGLDRKKKYKRTDKQTVAKKKALSHAVSRCPESIELAKKFLHSGARQLLSSEHIDFEAEFSKLSRVFDKIATFEYVGEKGINEKYENEKVVNAVFARLCDTVKRNDTELLKIKGPVGSYKNRIMQYLYLAMSMCIGDVVPFYIDLAYYEKNDNMATLVTDENIIEEFGKDIEKIDEILKNNPGKTPVLFLDGLRDFYCFKETFCYRVKEQIKKRGFKLVVCEDTDFTVNGMQKYPIHPIATNGYQMYLRIRSMNLVQRSEGIEFIRECINVFPLPVQPDISPEQIYDCLGRHSFLEIDAYWLMYILKADSSALLSEENDLADLYDSICLSALGSYDSIESVSEFAYNFEFGNLEQRVKLKGFNHCWKLLRKHRSIIDYLVAKQYVKKISELDFKKYDRNEIIRDLSFFNMVLQKNITRFVVAMIKGVDDYEHQIMKIASEYYDSLSLFGKSELTFWMARLESPKRRKECAALLRKYNAAELEKYRRMDPRFVLEKRDAAFLIRGINVSLIYESDRDALEYYLSSLLNDKVANSVNRGFHLEYYGDKPYIPNKSLLDFEDDITKGKSTLTVICMSLERRIENGDTSSFVALLEIMTLCNLIQARIEYTGTKTPLDVKSYIPGCITYLEWILDQNVFDGLEEVESYFRWMLEELNRMKEHNTENSKATVYKSSSVMNEFGEAVNVRRTGWVEMNIESPENIAEHMYSCWLIGMLYLPEYYDDEDYNKDVILKMLLIHDLGEVRTGDISRPEKKKNKPYYDGKENEAMMALLLSGTYPSSVNLSEYLGYWKRWGDTDDINYQIAKEIDDIQMMYRFCKYCNQYEELKNVEKIRHWLKDLRSIHSEVGKKIANILICDNDDFAGIMKILNNKE